MPDTATVVCVEGGFDSADGSSRIRALTWIPESHYATQPRAIIQIVHGMAEHVDRYDDFARFLAGNGFVVCAADVIGHGSSVDSSAEWGCLPSADGKRILLEDVRELRAQVRDGFPAKTPHILFGHSMGSFVARCYAAAYGFDLTGLILCGTGQQPVQLSLFGNALARLLSRVHGDAYRSKLLDQVGMGAYSKAIDHPRTSFDWLNTNPAAVDAYIADPECGYMFSVGGYATLTALTLECATPDHAQRIPKNLPMLFISGSLDPVGDCGKGVLQAADLYRAAQVATVDVHLFEGMRHEILNEPKHDEVYRFVEQWIEGIIQGEGN